MSSSESCEQGDIIEFKIEDEILVRSKIESRGFYIARNIVPREYIDIMRNAWLAEYARNVAMAPIIWGPFLGESNRILYHKTETCCMFRSYDFLWNTPIDKLTRDIGIKLSRLRNRIAESELLAGETIESDRYGIYITTSYYPPDEGWMAEHQDQADCRRHWHFMLLLTFKGDAYTDGGLFLIDKKGQRIDVDAEVVPGDVIFFDGSCTHGVEPISGGAGIGRLQMFSIPTFMETPQQNDRMLEGISAARFLKAKLRPLKYRLMGKIMKSGKIH